LNFLRPKIKQIFQRVLAGIFHPKLVLGVVLFLFVFVYCFSHTNTVNAEDYDYSRFKLSTTININGTPGNFIKVVSGQPINLQATIKIDAPDAGIILNGDTRIDFRWVKGVGTAAAQIKEVGLGVESVYEESKDCSQMSNWSGENYVACSFDTAKYVIAKNQLTDGKTIPAGKEFVFNITLDNSKLEKLGLLKHKDSSNVGSFTIQPYFLLDFPYSIDFEGSTFLTKPNNVVFVGKEVYVQFFSTQAELTASGDNKPNTVPNYGSITSGVQETQIRGIPKLINDVFTAVAQFVISGIFSIFTTLIAPMLTGVLSVRVYTDAFVNVIYPGWEVLRNVVNIYFIVAIIAIALATLFRVESYKFRPLLIKLIIAALIVNFSLVVCQVILAVADTLQSQFLPNNAEVIGALAKDLMPAQIADIIRSNQLVTNSVFGTAVTTLFLMSMAIGGFLVFVAILGYLFIRIVMIWIFLILSPLAFAADVLPSTSGMGQKWWGEFIKYAFFTPVMAFFLNMAAVIAVNYESIFGSISTNLVYGSSDYSKFTVLILATASNILLLVFLFGAVNIAQSFGVFGANVVDGVFKTGVFAPFVASGAVGAIGLKGIGALGGLARRTYTKHVSEKILDYSMEGQAESDVAKRAGVQIALAKKNIQEARASGDTEALEAAEKDLHEWEHRQSHAEAHAKKLGRKSALWRGLSFLDLKVVKEAWKKRDHQKELQAYQPAVGNMVDTFNRVVPTEWYKAKSLSGKKTYYGIISKRGVVDTEAKELLAGIRTREEAARILDGALKGGDKDEVEAALKALQENNQTDDYENIEGRTFSIIRYLQGMTKRLKEIGFSQEELTLIFSDLQESAEAKGRLRGYGYVNEDDDGVVRMANDFGYYENLHDTNKQVAILKNYADQYAIQARETHSEEFEALSNAFNQAAEGLQSGRFSSFTEAVNNTTYADRTLIPEEEIRDDMNLGNAITSMRFWNQMLTKTRRGGGGIVARNLEAAVIADQELDGWKKQNLLGKIMLRQLSPQIIQAFVGRIHEGQPRTLLGFGAIIDSATGEWKLPSLEIVNKTDAQIDAEAGGDEGKIKILKKQRDEHRYGWRRVINTKQMSDTIFNTLVTSDRLFLPHIREKFAKEFNSYKSSNPRYSSWDDVPAKPSKTS
jgi:hypothetical protein